MKSRLAPLAFAWRTSMRTLRAGWRRILEIAEPAAGYDDRTSLKRWEYYQLCVSTGPNDRIAGGAFVAVVVVDGGETAAAGVQHTAVDTCRASSADAVDGAGNGFRSHPLLNLTSIHLHLQHPDCHQEGQTCRQTASLDLPRFVGHSIAVVAAEPHTASDVVGIVGADHCIVADGVAAADDGTSVVGHHIGVVEEPSDL